MTWTNHSEMTLVQGRKFGLPQAFNHCENSSIDKSKVGVGVSITEVARTLVVL
ncbi:MAG TPA: hypothetical protein VHX16_01505 [Chloroflexota bacterium]|nr:hypothetical protein [Chloroflexota bacterium]